MNQFVKNISSVKMSSKMFVVSIFLCICFVLTINSAPTSISSPSVEENTQEDTDCHNSSMATDDSTENLELIQSIFVKTDTTNETSDYSEENTESSISEETTTIPDKIETKDDMIIVPELILRTIITVETNCQQGQKKDRKGRCRTVLNKK